MNGLSGNMGSAAGRPEPVRGWRLRLLGVAHALLAGEPMVERMMRDATDAPRNTGHRSPDVADSRPEVSADEDTSIRAARDRNLVAYLTSQLRQNAIQAVVVAECHLELAEKLDEDVPEELEHLLRSFADSGLREVLPALERVQASRRAVPPARTPRLVWSSDSGRVDDGSDPDIPF